MADAGSSSRRMGKDKTASSRLCTRPVISNQNNNPRLLFPPSSRYPLREPIETVRLRVPRSLHHRKLVPSECRNGPDPPKFANWPTPWAEPCCDTIEVTFVQDSPLLLASSSRES